MEVVLTAVLLGCIGLGIYLLYLNGYIPVQSKRAWVFIGSMSGRNQCSASFQSTTGTVRRVIRWKQPRTITFRFTGNITDGSVNVFVLDRNKQVLLMLNPECPSGELYVQSKERYYLNIKFQNADGDFLVKWD